MNYQNTLSFARQADQEDDLRVYRKVFFMPRIKNKRVIYFAGHSLGLQPKATTKKVLEELEKWKNLGVLGHHAGKHPWVSHHMLSKKILAKIVGAYPSEVVAMNQLTVNLHLMMTSFYRPTKKRFKILAEDCMFSSDRYALESQINLHGFSPEDALVLLKPRKNNYCLSTKDIISSIDDLGDELALILLGGVQYYTGQFFDLRRITRAGHRVGSMVGYDLAHAVGNVPLHLHRDGVDFSLWCGYKYLNSGPGGIGGVFIHRRHHNDSTIPRLAGWWGHDEKERFQMTPTFKPMKGADGWQLSNISILSSTSHLVALSLFEEVGMSRLRKKSVALTGYLYFLLKKIDPSSRYFIIITPEDPRQRGCQLSLLIKKNGKQIFDRLTMEGVVADWRSPNVIRLAPTPLYNTYKEVYRSVNMIKKAIHYFSTGQRTFT